MISFRNNPKSSLKFTIIIYLLVLIIWSAYRFLFRLPEKTEELIVKPVIWLLPILIISSSEMGAILKGFSVKSISYKDLFLSFGAGLGLAGLQLVTTKGLKLVTDINLTTDGKNLDVLVIVTATALTEEIFFRGFLLNSLARYNKLMVANIITSLLFALIHLPIIMTTTNYVIPNVLLGLYIVAVTSFVFGMLYLRKRNLWMPVLAHLVNNFLLNIYN